MKELSNEDIIILEHFLSYFRIYHEGISNKQELKEKTKKLFFDMCEEYSLNPSLAVNFLSQKFKDLDGREHKISSYETFENLGEVVDIDEYDEK